MYLVPASTRTARFGPCAPFLKRVVLGKLAAGGKKAEKAFVLRASKAQVDYMGDY